jgi:hypothetical protein
MNKEKKNEKRKLEELSQWGYNTLKHENIPRKFPV